MKLTYLSKFSSLNVDQAYRHDFEYPEDYCQKFAAGDSVRVQGLLESSDLSDPDFYLLECDQEFDIDNLVGYTNGNTGSNTEWKSIIYANNTFVAVGWDGNFATSPDGINWTTGNTGLSTNLNDITYANNTFVAVGRGGNFATSPDGINWTTGNIGSTTIHLNCVTYGSGIFVAFFTSHYATSPDGINWTIRNEASISGGIFDITYGNNTFVGVGFSGNFATSPDGINWTTGKINLPGLQPTLSSITYGNNIFIAVGEYGNFATSPDGINWTTGNTGANVALYSIDFTGNMMFAVGTQGVFVYTFDGINWNKKNIGSKKTMNSVVYHNGIYLAVGSSGLYVLFHITLNINVTYYENNNSTSIIDVDISNYIYPGCFKLVIYSPDEDIIVKEFYFKVLDEYDPDLDDTVLIRYTNDVNQFDYHFLNSDSDIIYTDFRVEGAFPRYLEEYEHQTETFRNQDYYLKQPSSYPYTIRTLSIGDGKGVPGWVGEKLNFIFSLSDVEITTNAEKASYVRSEGGQVTKEIFDNYYPLFIYNIPVERKEKRYSSKVDY